jgi:hypothetical protein
MVGRAQVSTTQVIFESTPFDAIGVPTDGYHESRDHRCGWDETGDALPPFDLHVEWFLSLRTGHVGVPGTSRLVPRRMHAAGGDAGKEFPYEPCG